jgi:Tfp pilus assembly protein PilX
MSKNPKYLKSKIPKIKAKKGIALLIALGTMIVILTIGSLSIYLITKGLKVTAGQTRYETAYESAVASLEIGKARANFLNQNFSLSDTSEVIQVGKYTVNLDVERTSSGAAYVPSGMAQKFGRAIAGPGSSAGAAGGSYRTYYVKVKSVGRAGEQVTLEVLQRYTMESE